MSTTTLRGITWAHSRGYMPLVAAAQRYHELHPEISIIWESRSLKDFEEFPIEQLASRYDLLVIDHPFAGFAATKGVLLALEEHLPADFMADQATNAVGQSHASYQWAGHAWALAIDAACPVAAWRPDLLQRLDLALPATWDDLLRLARSGHVDIPGAPINCLMNFMGLCASLGEVPGKNTNRLVSPAVGREALALLRDLTSACDPASAARNPIAAFEALASADNEQVAYLIFPYGYSNYSRVGYAAHRVVAGDLVTLESGGPPMTSVLGGTGLAVSAMTAHAAAATAFASFVASGPVQRTLYTQHGGQPGHRSAWLDHANNAATLDYFTRTLPTLDRAMVRPRHAGYLHEFQAPAGPLIHAHVYGHAPAADTLTALDRLFAASHHTF